VLLMCQVSTHSDLLLPTILLYPLSFKLLTIGSQTFPIAAAKIWNTLPDTVISASFINSFQHQLKAFQFQQSFCC